MSSEEPKAGRRIWSSISRRAKAAFSEDGSSRLEHRDLEKQSDLHEMPRKSDEHSHLHKRFEALATSLSHFGGSLGNAIEGGFTLVETKASSILSLDRLRKSPSRRRRKHADAMAESEELLYSIQDIMQLKASRDVAIVIGNRAKQEAKIANADLECFRERCEQLQDENQRLKELVEQNMEHEEDELLRMQLEALHLEKSRLASENEKLSREIRFLKELTEFHQLTLEAVPVMDDGEVGNAPAAA